MASTIFVPPDSAAVLNGYLVPGASFLEAMINRLRIDLRNDEELSDRWKQDPRAVLAERGIVRDLQDEILREQGLPVEQRAPQEEWCLSTGSCCCETL